MDSPEPQEAEKQPQIDDDQWDLLDELHDRHQRTVMALRATEREIDVARRLLKIGDDQVIDAKNRRLLSRPEARSG